MCQIIEKVTQVSGTARALHPKGIGDTFTAEVQDRLIETKRDLEWYFLNGTKTLEADSTPRQMAGLLTLSMITMWYLPLVLLVRIISWMLSRKCGITEHREPTLLL